MSNTPSVPKKVFAKLLNVSEKEIEELLDEENFAGKVDSVFSEKMRIEIPKTMNKLQASTELKRQWDEEETTVRIFQEFKNWYPFDALNAFTDVFKSHFGWINSVPTGLFRNIPPLDFKIQVGPNEYKSVFFGNMEVSAWDNAEVSVGIDGKGGFATINVVVKKRFRKEVDDLLREVRSYLEKNSIFSGKTVVVNSPRDFNFPHFEIIDNIPNDKIILNEGANLVIENFILPEIVEKRNKRIYLFTGSYGNGKTETAMRIGNFATSEGLMFFYCKNSQYFQFLLNLSKNYNPSLIFLEDIDEIGAGEQRDSQMNFLLNTLDGVESKGTNLKVIFTTNHEDKINHALRRPGRIDMVVEFDNPDKVSVAEIYRSYLKDFDNFDNLDLVSLAEDTPDVQGAFIAEIAKRAVKLAVREGQITMSHVKASIQSMMPQVKLMQSEIKKDSEAEIFYRNFARLIDRGYAGDY